MDFQLLAKGIALAGCAIGAGCALIAGIGPGIGEGITVVFKFNRLVGYIIKKITVMADDNHCALEISQKAFKP